MAVSIHIFLSSIL